MRTVIYDPGQPVVIRTFGHDSQAELARALLDAADIPSMLVRVSGDGFGTGPVQVAVRRKDVDVALEVLSVPADQQEGNATSE